MAEQQVFISYAWGGESESVADEIEALLQANPIRLVRDKNDLGFKGLIREFMEEIGKGNLVILIISDKYLKSKNCMFELLEVAKKGEFHSRIFPVVLSDANIYDSLGLITYLKYWDQKIKELNASVKKLDNLADTRKVQEDINLYTDIRGAIDDLAGKISDMNTLTLEIMRAKKYQPLLDALKNKPSPIVTPQGPTKKEGKVLYHIPGMMQINAWTRCTVRLAWEEILLIEGLKIPREELQIESIRLAKTMQVSLTEGKKGGNFEISPINNEEQYIDEDDFTEWLYDVKPLNQGSFTLILRITLIQSIDGKEKKKDIVLEREVITETVVPKALQKFETAKSGLPKPETPLDPNIYPEVAEESEEEKPIVFDGNPAKINRNWELTESKANEEEIEEKPAKNLGSGKSSNKGYTGSAQRNTSSLPPNKFNIPTLDPSFPQENFEPTKSGSPKKWLIPMAASVVGLLMVSVFIFSNLDSNMSSSTFDPELGEIPSTDTALAQSPNPNQPNPEEKMLLTLSLDATGPDGESVNEVMLFIVEKSQLEFLSAEDLEGYVADTSAISEEMTISLGAVSDLTVQEIKDTIQVVTKKPILIGNKMIDRKNLKIHSGN